MCMWLYEMLVVKRTLRALVSPLATTPTSWGQGSCGTYIYMVEGGKSGVKIGGQTRGRGK